MTFGEIAKVFLSIFVMMLGLTFGVGALPVWRAVVAWAQGAEVDTTRLGLGLKFLVIAVLVLWLGGRLWWRTMYRYLEHAQRKAAQEKEEARRSPALEAFNERLDVFTTRLNRWLVGWLIFLWVALLGLGFLGEYHWALGTLFFVWMLGALLGLRVFLSWVERWLCRELGLMCPHCERTVIITSRRRKERPEPLECQRCGGGLEELVGGAGMADGTGVGGWR